MVIEIRDFKTNTIDKLDKRQSIKRIKKEFYANKRLRLKKKQYAYLVTKGITQCNHNTPIKPKNHQFRTQFRLINL